MAASSLDIDLIDDEEVGIGFITGYGYSYTFLKNLFSLFFGVPGISMFGGFFDGLGGGLGFLEIAFYNYFIFVLRSSLILFKFSLKLVFLFIAKPNWEHKAFNLSSLKGKSLNNSLIYYIFIISIWEIPAKNFLISLLIYYGDADTGAGAGPS